MGVKTFGTLRDEVEQELQDTLNLEYGTGEIDIQLEDAIREISDAMPRVDKFTFEFESRTGTTTSTLASWIVDSTAQFIAATDVGKVIYNTTDRTWAKVISNGANSTTQLALSKDIMTSGENYAMFNQDCWDSRQIYIGDITDYIGDDHGVIAVEYKTLQKPRRFRNFQVEGVEGKVLTVEIEDNPPDSSGATADIEVFVWIHRMHQVTQQTLTTMYVKNGAGYSAGDSAIVVDYDAGVITGTIQEGANITFANTRGDYILKSNATFSSDQATLQIFPGLQNDVADDTTVSLLKSSLNRRQERLVVELAAARCGVSKTINANNIGGRSAYAQFKNKLDEARAELERISNSQVSRTTQTYSREN